MTSKFADNQYMLHKFISDVITCAAGAAVVSGSGAESSDDNGARAGG